jgi:nitronate monooxygenase
MEGEGASLEELLPLISGGAERKALLETGDVNSAVIHCGQAVGSVHEIPSVMEIIENIISEAKIITQRLYNL